MRKPGGSRSAASWAPVTAVALSVAVGLPLVRVSIALLYGLRESSGAPTAVAIAAVIFSAPLIAVTVRRAVGPRVSTSIALAGLAVTSATVQLAHPIALWVAGLGVGFALGSWTLLLHAGRDPAAIDGSRFAFAFVTGLAIDTTVHASFGTWDAAWQTTPAALVVGLSLALALAATAPAVMRGAPLQPDTDQSAGTSRVIALGPFLALQVLLVHNVAFASAASGASIAAGAAAVLTGTSAAMAAIIWVVPRWNRRVAHAAGAAAIVALTWVLPAARGRIVLAALMLAGALSGWLLSVALSRTARRVGAWRTGAVATIGSLSFVTIVFLYQIHYSQPLPVSNRFLPPLAAAMLGLAAVGIRPEPRPPATPGWWRVVVVPVAIVAGGALALAAMRTPPQTSTTLDGSLRIVSWNVHAAVDGNGQVAPDAVAGTIAEQHADVVILQEVSRGWPIGGSLDLAAWLSARLEMPFTWGPAADSQFGNVMLSRVPIAHSQVVVLPFGSGPQHRSLVRVDLAGGPSTISIVGTHVESGLDTDTRAQQIEVLLDAAASATAAVIAGDMNMQPSDDDVSLFAAAGYVSAQDETGNGETSTAREPEFPGDRPDWIFGSPGVTFSDFTVVPSDVSDHRPLVVTVDWPPERVS